MSLAEGMTPADIGAVMGNRDNDCWGGNGAYWIIILFLFAFMGNGFFGNRGKAPQQPVTEAGLCSAMNFNDLQNAVGRLSDNENMHMMQLSQGLSSVGYENLRNFADTQSAIKDGNYALSSQLADCCCKNRYDALQQASQTQRMIDQTNFNIQSEACAIKNTDNMNARDIINNQNDNARAIIDKLSQQELNAKQAKIDDLERKVSALSLAQSQTLQNQYLVGQLRPAPIPAFNVPQPYYAGGTVFA